MHSLHYFFFFSIRFGIEIGREFDSNYRDRVDEAKMSADILLFRANGLMVLRLHRISSRLLQP
jgi:hypothetical protein